jgi:hypothetical protein
LYSLPEDKIAIIELTNQFIRAKRNKEQEELWKQRMDINRLVTKLFNNLGKSVYGHEKFATPIGKKRITSKLIFDIIILTITLSHYRCHLFDEEECCGRKTYSEFC